MIKEPIANLDAHWNHRGDKFCVGSSSGQVYMAQWFTEGNYWVA